MKKNLIIASMIIVSTLSYTSCYHRIGKLTIASTRNIESKAEYVLLGKEASGKAKTKKDDALELAIDKAVKEFPTGEFMKNVIIYVRADGRKIRVKGDVCGFPAK